MQLEDLVNGVKDVVPLPKAYLRIQELVNDPDSSLAEVTQVISNDPGLTSRILRIANSAYMGLASKVDTIGRAVQILGLNQVHDLALASAAIGSLFKAQTKALDIYDFWRRSIYCAIVARLLAKRARLSAAERLFVAGLLHEIGNLILAFKEPALYTELRAAAARRQAPLSMVQHDQFGFDYAAISAELLRQWQLPAALQTPVRDHTQDLTKVQPESLQETAILQVAATVSRAAMWHTETDEPVPEFDPVATQLMNIDGQFVEDLMSEADGMVVEAMGLLIPDYKTGAGAKTAAARI